MLQTRLVSNNRKPFRTPKIKTFSILLERQHCSSNLNLTINRPDRYLKVSVRKELENFDLKKEQWEGLKEEGLKDATDNLDWNLVKKNLEDRYGSEILKKGSLLAKYEIGDFAFASVFAVQYEDVNEKFITLKTDCFIYVNNRLIQIVFFWEYKDDADSLQQQKNYLVKYVKKLKEVNT